MNRKRFLSRHTNNKPGITILLIFLVLRFAYAQEQPLDYALSSEVIANQMKTKGMQLLPKDSIFTSEFDKRFYIGIQLSRRGDENAAIYWYRYALQSKAAYKADSIKTYNQLYISYNIIGLPHNAMNALISILRMAEDSSTINKTNISISRIYIQIQAFDKALVLINKCIDVAKKQRDTADLITAYSNKARIYKELNQPRNSLTYSLQSYYLATRLSHKNDNMQVIKSGVHIGTNNIADAYLTLNMSDSALFYLDKISRSALDSAKAYVQAVIYTSYAEAYTIKGAHQKAIAYFQKALALQDGSSGFYNVRTTAYKTLSKLYAQSRQYEKAWQYENAYSEVYKEVVRKENNDKINSLHNQYTLERKDLQLAQKDLLINNHNLKLKHKNTMVYFLLTLFVLSAIIIVVLARNYTVRKKLNRTQLLNLERENDISVIAATLQGEETERERIARELHDSIVSEVSILKMSIFELGKQIRDINSYPEYKSILKQSESIKGKIRQVAHDLVPVRLQQLGLHKAITTFADRLSSNALRFHFQAIGNPVTLAPQKEKVVFMMIQELAQNILKHAHATEATIQLNYFDEALSITIEDNGVGIGLPEHRREGMGLRNIRHYVEKLDGSLDMHSSEYIGTTILIELPLHALLAQEQDKTMH